MTVNRSLDEFADAGAEEADEATGGSEVGEASVTSPVPAADEPSDGSGAIGSTTEHGEATVDDVDVDVDDGDLAVDEEDAATVVDTVDESNDPDDDSDNTDDGSDDAVDDASERDEVGQPISTYAWAPDGGPCSTCSETVEERWRDDDAFVCVRCKEW